MMLWFDWCEAKGRVASLGNLLTPSRPIRGGQCHDGSLTWLVNSFFFFHQGMPARAGFLAVCSVVFHRVFSVTGAQYCALWNGQWEEENGEEITGTQHKIINETVNINVFIGWQLQPKKTGKPGFPWPPGENATVLLRSSPLPHLQGTLHVYSLHKP